MLRSLRKKENNKLDKSYIPEAFSDKVTRDIDFIDEAVIQCNALFVNIRL